MQIEQDRAPLKTVGVSTWAQLWFMTSVTLAVVLGFVAAHETSTLAFLASVTGVADRRLVLNATTRYPIDTTSIYAAFRAHLEVHPHADTMHRSYHYPTAYEVRATEIRHSIQFQNVPGNRVAHLTDADLVPNRSVAGALAYMDDDRVPRLLPIVATDMGSRSSFVVHADVPSHLVDFDGVVMLAAMAHGRNHHSTSLAATFRTCGMTPLGDGRVRLHARGEVGYVRYANHRHFQWTRPARNDTFHLWKRWRDKNAMVIPMDDGSPSVVRLEGIAVDDATGDVLATALSLDGRVLDTQGPCALHVDSQDGDKIQAAAKDAATHVADDAEKVIEAWVECYGEDAVGDESGCGRNVAQISIDVYDEVAAAVTVFDDVLDDGTPTKKRTDVVNDAFSLGGDAVALGTGVVEAVEDPLALFGLIGVGVDIEQDASSMIDDSQGFGNFDSYEDRYTGCYADEDVWMETFGGIDVLICKRHGSDQHCKSKSAEKGSDCVRLMDYTHPDPEYSVYDRRCLRDFFTEKKLGDFDTWKDPRDRCIFAESSSTSRIDLRDINMNGDISQWSLYNVPSRQACRINSYGKAKGTRYYNGKKYEQCGFLSPRFRGAASNVLRADK